jgi:hypothetical protein
MTLIEAVKSGKKYKRPEWKNFYSNEEICFSGNDILADDYILEETELKRGLYVSEGGEIMVLEYTPNHIWKRLSKTEFEGLFE